MGFLVASPPVHRAQCAEMLKDMRSWRETVREQSLRNFHHKMEWQAPLPRAVLAQQMVMRLKDSGYAAKVSRRTTPLWSPPSVGAANKLGLYLCPRRHRHHLRGRLARFGNADPRTAMVLGKTHFAGSGVIADIPAQHRLSLSNPTFRGNTMIPEARRAHGHHSQADGVLTRICPSPSC